MTINDIIALAHAGFTADQISRLAAIPATQPAPAPAPAPAPVVPPAPPAPPAPPVPDTQVQDFMAAINGGFDRMLTAMQQQAITQAQQPPEETVGDILASIINPTNRQEG